MVPTDQSPFGLKATTDIQVSTSDIVGIVTTRYETSVRANVRAAEKRADEATKSLEKANTALREKCDDEAKKYGVKELNKFEEAFKLIGLGFQSESKVAVGDKGFTITHTIWSHKSSNYHGSRENEIDWTTEVSFHKAGAKTLCTNIAKAEAALAAAQKLRIDWQRKLSDIPNVERRASAAIAERALNQSEGGQQLMESISASFANEFGDLEELAPIALIELQE